MVLWILFALFFTLIIGIILFRGWWWIAGCLCRLGRLLITEHSNRVELASKNIICLWGSFWTMILFFILMHLDVSLDELINVITKLSTISRRFLFHLLLCRFFLLQCLLFCSDGRFHKLFQEIWVFFTYRGIQIDLLLNNLFIVVILLAWLVLYLLLLFEIIHFIVVIIWWFNSCSIFLWGVKLFNHLLIWTPGLFKRMRSIADRILTGRSLISKHILISLNDLVQIIWVF